MQHLFSSCSGNTHKMLVVLLKNRSKLEITNAYNFGAKNRNAIFLIEKYYIYAKIRVVKSCFKVSLAESET